MLAVPMSPPIATIPAFMSGSSGHKPDSASNPIKPKPKLSLQTNALSTAFGGLSRGIASNVSTQATTTPTTNNTYANTWDLTFRPSPVSRTSSPRPFANRPSSPHQPYQIVLPFGVRPILKNSPIPTDARRGSITSSPRESRRKVLFPQPKKVTFKRHLEDVIETIDYIARHSDLTSSSDNESSSSDSSADSSQTDETSETRLLASPPPTKRRRQRKDDADRGTSSSPASDDAEQQEEISVTPRADRKRRRWEWTLGPVRGDQPITAVAPYTAETGTTHEVKESTKVRKSADGVPTITDDSPLPRHGAEVEEGRCAPDKMNKKSLPTQVEITTDHPKPSAGDSGNLQEEIKKGTNEPQNSTGKNTK